ncbi:MAG TPA: hypothetical protein PK971_04420 [Saprospiraceae bacterium]|nr:hypothetical protein [Saprospiraceae bacterium]HND87546.1 hypothetical protein [Saprospiraceae bacterium]
MAALDDADEAHPLFPSGEWEGFYTYATGPDAQRYPMSFMLRFQMGAVSGAGIDLIAAFTWRGHYDTQAMRCQMTKHYPTHTVFYDGHADENGIWGMWQMSADWRGGFHIWPKKGQGEEEATEQSAADIGAEQVREHGALA